jgi:hypothetical protein
LKEWWEPTLEPVVLRLRPSAPFLVLEFACHDPHLLEFRLLADR